MAPPFLPYAAHQASAPTVLSPISLALSFLFSALLLMYNREYAGIWAPVGVVYRSGGLGRTKETIESQSLPDEWHSGI